MSATSDLLDRVREGANIPSDNVLSQRLGITRAVISGWRNGNYPVPDERIAQLCDMAKLDGPLWMALIDAERATSAVERKIWRLMLDRISAAAAVVALVALSLPSIGNAKTAQNQAVSAGLLTHSVYYVQAAARLAGTALASPPDPVAAWSLIVRDRNLTGPWAGFSFKAGRLVTPEGRELLPEDLAWLSLTAAQAQEWRRLMEDASSSKIRARDRRKPLAYKAAEIVDLRDAIRRRTEKRLSGVMAGPDAEPPVAVLPVPGPTRRQRV